MAKEWQDHFGVDCSNCGQLFDHHRASDLACPNERIKPYEHFHHGWNDNSKFK